MSVTNTRLLTGANSPCWPVSGLTERPSSPSQVLVQGTQWLVMKAEHLGKSILAGAFVRFTVAGAAQVKSGGAR